MNEYIEREAAYEDFEKCNSENPKWTPSRVKALIARQKAADVALVRHGRWEKVAWWQHQNRYECNECSLCGCRVKPKFTYNYCPNCGARMDGGVNREAD